MQSKEIIKQGTSTEWAVAIRIGYVSKTAIQSKNVQRSYSEKVRLANLDTYEQTNWTDTDPNAPQFVKTTSDRVKRFLVTDGTSYRVVPASEFIDHYASMEKKWVEAEARAQQQQAINQQRQSVREQAVTQANINRDAVRESIADGLKAMLGYQGALGTRIDVDVAGDFVEADGQPLRYETKLIGSVNLPYDQFMRLVEKFNELQDA